MWKQKLTTLAIAVSATGAALISLPAQEGPQWWFDEGIVETPAPPPAENYKLANLGQAINLATAAYAELSEVIPGGPSFDLEDLFPAITLPIDPADAADYYGTINIGQLKALAGPFYDEIASLSTGWLYDHYELSYVGLSDPTATDPSGTWGNKYPWEAEEELEDNYKPANLGQLKLAFALDFSRDTDDDGAGDDLPDLFEYWIIRQLGSGDLDSIGKDDDADEDGVSNYDEYVAGTNPVDPVLTNGSSLVGHWRLDDLPGSAIIADGSEYNRIGLATGDYILSSYAGVSGGAMEFGDGTGGTPPPQLELPYSVFYDAETAAIPNTASTLAVWLKKEAGTGGMRIFSARDDADSAQLLVTAFDDRVEVETPGLGSALASAGHGSLADGVWHHVVVVRHHGASGEVTIYVDGVERASASGITAALDVDQGKFFAGIDPAAANTGYLGWMDDIRVYDRALRPPELLELATQAVDIDGDGLPDWWERAHFTGFVFADGTTVPTPLFFSGTSDPDDDRFSNAAEFAAGTDPAAASGRLMEFRFEDAPGATDVVNTADDQYNGVPYADPFQFLTEGVLGRAFECRSNDAHATVGGGAGLDGLTSSYSVSVWLNVTGWPANDLLVLAVATDPDSVPADEIAMQLFVEQTAPGVRRVGFVNNTDGAANPPVPMHWDIPAGGLDDGEWHHLLVVIEENGTTDDATCYLDGASLGTEDTLVAPAPGDLAFQLGANSDSHDYLLDEFRIYSRALDSTEIGLESQMPANPGGGGDVWGGYTGGRVAANKSGRPEPGGGGGGGGGGGASPGDSSGGGAGIAELMSALTQRVQMCMARDNIQANPTFDWETGSIEADIHNLNLISFNIDEIKGKFLNVEKDLFEAGNRTGELNPFDDDSLPPVGRINLDNYATKIPQLNAALHRLRFLMWPSTASGYTVETTYDPFGDIRDLSADGGHSPQNGSYGPFTNLRHTVCATIGGPYGQKANIYAQYITNVRVAGAFERVAILERRLWGPTQFSPRLPEIGRGYVTRGTGADADFVSGVDFGTASWWSGSLSSQKFRVSMDNTFELIYEGPVLRLQGIDDDDQNDIGVGLGQVCIEVCAVADIGTAGLTRAFGERLSSPGGAPVGSFTLGVNRTKLIIPLGLGITGSDQAGALAIVADRPPADLDHIDEITSNGNTEYVPILDNSDHADVRVDAGQFSLGHHSSLQVIGNRHDFEIIDYADFDKEVAGQNERQAHPPFKLHDGYASSTNEDERRAYRKFAVDHWDRPPIEQVKSGELLLTISYSNVNVFDHDYFIEFYWASEAGQRDGGDGRYSPTGDPFRRIRVVDDGGILRVSDPMVRREDLTGTGTRENQEWNRGARWRQEENETRTSITEIADYDDIVDVQPPPPPPGSPPPDGPTLDHKIHRNGVKIYDVVTKFEFGQDPFLIDAAAVEIKEWTDRTTTIAYAGDDDIPYWDPTTGDPYDSDNWRKRFFRIANINYADVVSGWDLAGAQDEFFTSGALQDGNQIQKVTRFQAGKTHIDESSFDNNAGKLTTNSKLDGKTYSTSTRSYDGGLPEFATTVGNGASVLLTGDVTLTQGGPFAWSTGMVREDGSPTLTLTYEGGLDDEPATIRRISGDSESEATIDRFGVVEHSRASEFGVDVASSELTGRHKSGNPRGYTLLNGDTQSYTYDQYGFIDKFTPRSGATATDLAVNAAGEVYRSTSKVGDKEATTTYEICKGSHGTEAITKIGSVTVDERITKLDSHGELESATSGDPARRQTTVSVAAAAGNGRTVTYGYGPNITRTVDLAQGGFVSKVTEGSMNKELVRTLLVDGAGRVCLTETAEGRTYDTFSDGAGRLVERVVPSAATGSSAGVSWNFSYAPAGENDTVTIQDPDNFVTTQDIASGFVKSIAPTGRKSLVFNRGPGGAGLEFGLDYGGRLVGNSSFSPASLSSQLELGGDSVRTFEVKRSLSGDDLKATAEGPDALTGKAGWLGGLLDGSSVNKGGDGGRQLLAHSITSRHSNLAVDRIDGTASGIPVAANLNLYDSIPNRLEHGGSIVTIDADEQDGGTYNLDIDGPGGALDVTGTNVEGDYTASGDRVIGHNVNVIPDGTTGRTDVDLHYTGTASTTRFEGNAGGAIEAKRYAMELNPPSISYASTAAGRPISVSNRRGHTLNVTRTSLAEGFLPNLLSWSNLGTQEYADPGDQTMTWANGEVATINDASGTRTLTRDAQHGNIVSQSFSGGPFPGATIVKHLDENGQPSTFNVVWSSQGGDAGRHASPDRDRDGGGRHRPHRAHPRPRRAAGGCHLQLRCPGGAAVLGRQLALGARRGGRDGNRLPRGLLDRSRRHLPRRDRWHRGSPRHRRGRVQLLLPPGLLAGADHPRRCARSEPDRRWLAPGLVHLRPERDRPVMELRVRPQGRQRRSDQPRLAFGDLDDERQQRDPARGV